MNRQFGWIGKGVPDHRDYGLDHPSFERYFKLNIPQPSVENSLVKYAPPILDQGEVGKCTAMGIVELYAYNEKLMKNRHTILSSDWIYYFARKFLKLTGDSGASGSAAMKVLTLIGAPPEKYWRPKNFDQSPNVEDGLLARQMAQAFQGLVWGRPNNLEEIKACIRAKFPVGFGFTCFESIDNVGKDGYIPFPSDKEHCVGGHYMVCDSYDDNRKEISGPNSWSSSWGEGGRYRLPYKYFDRGLCDDFLILKTAEHPDYQGLE